MVRVFISSVQKEFSEERRALVKYIREDALLRRFFEPFIFEELPAINLSAPEAYLYEAAHSDIYLGIFGKEYGYEDAKGVSPTEREFDKATEQGNHRIVFVKRCTERDPKETKFIKRVEEQLVRKGFNDFEELGTGTTDVVETCVAAGLPAPEYKQEQNHFISIIWRKRTDANGPQSGPQYLIDNKDIDNTDSQSGPQYGPQSGPQGKLAQRYRGLLETIIAKPTISKEDLAAQFNISLTTLKRDLKCLRQSYEITWIGWTQNGHWEVKELEKKKQ